ncbi:MAG: hypothetical protein ACT4QE_21835 [Anaerolineales bacterium]
MELAQATDIYAYHLGSLIGNLHSLEVLLRIAIASPGEATASIGEVVDANSIRQPIRLHVLIEQYNAKVSQTHPRHTFTQISEIVSLSERLAHSVVHATSAKAPLQLVEYAPHPEAGGSAIVERAYEMTPEWMECQRGLVWKAIQSVTGYLRERGTKPLRK